MKPTTMPKKSRRRASSGEPRETRMSRQVMAKLKKNKELADMKKADRVASCCTRTVEWPSTGETAEEKHKLLFALTLGLIPKFGKTAKPSPIVKVEKINPEVEASAKALTENRLNAMAQTTKLKSISSKCLYKSSALDHCDSITPVVPDINDPTKLVPLYLLPEVEEPHVSPEIVEFVDLCSDEEEKELIVLLDDDDDDKDLEPVSEPHVNNVTADKSMRPKGVSFSSLMENPGFLPTPSPSPEGSGAVYWPASFNTTVLKPKNKNIDDDLMSKGGNCGHRRKRRCPRNIHLRADE